MNRPEPLAVTVSTVIAAALTTVYDLISDITAMGRYNPETVAAHWLDGGTSVTDSISTERAMPALIRFFIRTAGVQDRTDHLRAGMRTTLDRLAQAAVDAESRSILQ